MAKNDTNLNLPWREAASLIMVTRASVQQIVGSDLGETMIATSRVLDSQTSPRKSSKPTSRPSARVDYRILMVKRSNIASFLASAFVFPGGKVDPADYSPAWWSVFNDSGLNPRQLCSSIRDRIPGARPPIVTSPMTMPAPHPEITRESPIPPDLALRITAIRETFEETGVLLLTKPSFGKSVPPTGCYSDTDSIDCPIDLGQWREKVHNDGYAFIELCRLLKQCPDIWSLYEWWDWLTPISVGHRRFDTMFYVCCLDKQPKVIVDNKEVTTLKWCSPIEMLEEHSEGNIFLAPPQVYELSRIHNLPNYRSVRDFARKRESLGVQRWLPVLSTYPDGAISFLPGDDLYPEKPDYTGTDPVPDFDETLDQVRQKSVNLNRLELRGPVCVAICNQKMPCGQLTPISYDSIVPALRSML